MIGNNLLSIGNSMLKFKIERNGMKALLTRYGEYFGLFKMQIDQLMEFVDNDSVINSKGPNLISIMNLIYNNS